MVLEHVSDVNGYFNKLVSLMCEDTYLYIEVPNERWCVDEEYVRIHEHISFFSEKTFRVMAANKKIDIVKLGNDGIIRVLLKKKSLR